MKNQGVILSEFHSESPLASSQALCSLSQKSFSAGKSIVAVIHS